MSECFAFSVRAISTVWIIYDLLTALIEIVTICIYQGLATPEARQNLDKRTALFRISMAGVLGLSLTAINIIALHDSAFSNQKEICGYRDVVHNCFQIIARVVFVYVVVKGKLKEEEKLIKLRNVESLTYNNSPSLTNMVIPEEGQCGLCYREEVGARLIKLTECGHTFHKDCFRYWDDYGQRCPLCRQIFNRSDFILDLVDGDEPEDVPKVN